MVNNMRNLYCSDCHCLRKPHDGKCWKCDNVLFAPAKGWEDLKLPPVNKIRRLARVAGYAIAIHGSQERDLDLVAIPWVGNAVNAKELMTYIAVGLGGKIIGEIEIKPHGRLACNIQMDGWFKLIDLSVTPKHKL